MTTAGDVFELLPWDSGFFGFRVARINRADIPPAALRGVIETLRAASVRLVYWGAASPPGPDHLAGLNARFVDEKTTLTADFSTVQGIPGSIPPEIEFHDAAMPAADFEALALQSGEHSRFAVDPMIPRAKYEELYRIWIRGSLDRTLARETLVIRREGRAVAMLTLCDKGGRGDLGLIAVDAAHRGRGYGELLVRAGQRWFLDHGLVRGQVVTQAASPRAVALYQKCGYVVAKVEYFHHIWL